MRQIAAIIAASVLLLGCGGSGGDGEDNVDFSSWKQASLVTSYPEVGQSEVPASAPVALRFSHSLTTADAVGELSFQTAGGDAVAFTAEVFADGRGLLLTPDQPLEPGTDYVVDVGDQTTRYGAVQMPDGGVSFTTQARPEGAESAVTTDGTFQVSRMIPDGDTLPLMDFSALRVQFTQPIDTTTLDYASDGTLALLDENGQLVPAHVLVKGRYLTVDPKQDLASGATYRLRLDAGLQSTVGNALQPGGYAEVNIRPRDSHPREVMIQQADVSNTDPGQRCGPDKTGDTLSPLTGMPVNCVPLQARLLGNTTSVQQEGILAAELAFPPNYPDFTPFRVKRGTLLTAASVEVLIAGVAPTGYDSGEVRVSFISDAVGYLAPNPYTTDKTAPKRVRMFMDVAMTTGGAKANAGLSQDLLHVELVGSAIVENGRLVINAVAAVEPKVLGQEYGQGLISFQMASFADQESAPEPAADTTPPTLQSWLPGETAEGQSREDEMRPGDPIIVNLSEPLDHDSAQLPGAITLSAPGNADLGFDVRVDGATLVIRPDTPLQYGTDYTLSLTGQLTDIAGNPLDQDYALSFTVPHYIGNGDRAPLVTTAYPGYACVTTDRDIANDDHGRCAGGQASDDHLPVMPLPANRAIEVQFSQTMDPDSIQLGGSVVVQRNSQPDGSGTWSDVPGRLEIGARILRFYPSSPWEEGALYRYVLGSNGDKTSSSAVCDGTDAICSLLKDGTTGYPLQTQMLAQSVSEAPSPTGGGPDMEIYFHGDAPTQSVLQTFRNLPTVDVNANLVHDGRTVGDDESTCTVDTCEALPASDGEGGYVVEENSANIIATGHGGLATGANTGCGFTSGGERASCPAKQFVWLTAGLNSEVLGTGTHPGTGQEAVRVAVHPNVIYTSNLDTYADTTLVGVEHTPSGPQIMRVRYETGSGGEPQPLTGWIYENAEGVPTFEVQADLYLDAPYLDPLLSLPHNLHSYEASMTLRGPVTFTVDGRMQVRLRNANAVPIDVVVGSTATNIQLDLQIPAQGTALTFTQPAIKQ